MSGSGESYWYNYQNDVLFGEKKEKLTLQKRLAFLEGEIYCYAKKEKDRTNPYLSPTYGDYFGFPPMYFNVGGHEMLLSDTLSVVKNLQAHGVPVECDIGEEMFHCYMLYKDFLPEGKKAYRNLLRFIKERYVGQE